ncbi:MAG TPA: butyrate kinase [candidate division WOR-3 bacterium]|uniref:Probable butyrate kinase n=1 Tax=candidate division WOR-3 bacterium TaxID=2052148 RepID=A0A7C5M6R8_UNCW3|nr:butyrate kinase [candidate division WOR-3 bacterium]
MDFKILVINPGSTSTKIALYRNEEEVFSTSISHDINTISKYERIIDQFDFRRETILQELEKRGIKLEELSAVVGRGGLLRPIPGGTYKVTPKMLEHLKIGIQGEHASNLGGLLADSIAAPLGIPAFIVDPVVVDEMEPIAKVTGLPEINRRSIFHALNQKRVARLASKDLGKTYETVNLIVVHLGGGISIGVHKRGKVVDVNNALNGDGPFAPERAGSLPAWDLVKLVLSGKYTEGELKKKLAGKGGIVAHLGTNDMRDVEKRIEQGDKKAEFIMEAMAYNVAKWIGAGATVLEGNVDAIVISGGLAYYQKFIDWIKKRVSFISRILLYPGGDEMRALLEGALRVLRGEEEAKIYEDYLKEEEKK